MAQAGAQAHSTEAMIPPIVASEQARMHSLAFMIGEDPDTLVSELSSNAALPQLPPVIPLGVPSDLLRRRPDIRQAERQLQAAFANVGVATAESFFRSLASPVPWDLTVVPSTSFRNGAVTIIRSHRGFAGRFWIGIASGPGSALKMRPKLKRSLRIKTRSPRP